MLFSTLIDAHVPLHLAQLLAVAALAFRNQLRLRGMLLISTLVAIIDHGLLRPSPLWYVLFWDAVAFAVNVQALVQLILDRTHIGLSNEERDLFRSFGVLSPGEFRQLVRLGQWKTVQEPTAITQEGTSPTHLYYVVAGGIELVKAGRSVMLDPQTFIGEVAFLKGRTASATVTLTPGSRFIHWPVTPLNQRLDRKLGLRVAVFRLLGADMASKVARS